MRPVAPPWWVRALMWPLRHWRLTLAAVAVLLLWVYRDLVVDALEIAAGAVVMVVGLLLFTRGRRGRGRPRHPVLAGLLLAMVAGWLAGRQPRRSR